MGVWGFARVSRLEGVGGRVLVLPFSLSQARPLTSTPLNEPGTLNPEPLKPKALNPRPLGGFILSRIWAFEDLIFERFSDALQGEPP